MQSVLSSTAISVSELKKNPTAVLNEADGEPVAVLNHNRVVGIWSRQSCSSRSWSAWKISNWQKSPVPAPMKPASRYRSMTYELEFLPSALKEWRKLGHTVREQLKRKLAERLVEPRVQADALHGMADHYKIKLRSAGYCLVYRVEDQRITVTVVAIGKREGGVVYELARKR